MCVHVHRSEDLPCLLQLQTPQSFVQSVNELAVALQRNGDPGNLSRLRPHYELLANVDPSPGALLSTACCPNKTLGESGFLGGTCLNVFSRFLPDTPPPSWENLEAVIKAVKTAVQGLVEFSDNSSGLRKSEPLLAQGNSKYKTHMCRDLAQKGRCPRGNNCTFAHSQDEMERQVNLCIFWCRVQCPTTSNQSFYLCVQIPTAQQEAGEERRDDSDQRDDVISAVSQRAPAACRGGQGGAGQDAGDERRRGGAAEARRRASLPSGQVGRVAFVCVQFAQTQGGAKKVQLQV